MVCQGWLYWPHYSCSKRFGDCSDYSSIIVTILGRYGGDCVVFTLLVNGEGYIGSWLGYSVVKSLLTLFSKVKKKSDLDIFKIN